MGLRAWILESEKGVRPLSDVMAEKYRELTDWLHQFDLTRDEIKETLPSLYLNIQNAIENLDRAFVNEDMTAFQDALDRVKALYLRTQSVSEAIYTGDEIRKLKGLSKDSLREIQKAKEVFPESNIEEIKKHVSGTQTEEIQN
jgi:hypothetical protein